MIVKSFGEIRKEDVEIAGGKGANLGEMVSAGISVPDGFVLTSEAYRIYVRANQLDTWIREQLLKAEGDEKQLICAAGEIRRRILKGTVPDEIRKELLDFYHKMESPRVAVRSSATAEDLKDASFAGQQETYLNVRGDEELLQKVKECYASLWGERAVFYRHHQGYDNKDVALAVVIQEMVESEVAGVLFTVNPSDRNREEVQINASYGLGESVVSGKVTPDEYICSRQGNILKSLIGSKETEIIYGSHGTKETAVSQERRKAAALSGEEIKKLVEAALKVEAHYQSPMDIEWAVRDGKIYLLQARAITTLHQAESCGDIEIGRVNNRIKKLMTFMLEKNPFAYYPLDYDLSMILGIKKEELLSETGINMDMEMHMDDNGVMVLPSGKIGLNSRIFRIKKTISDWLDCSRNEAEGSAHLEENQKVLHSLKEEPVEKFTLKECGGFFKELYTVMEDNAYARFRYAVFPSMLVGKKLERVIQKVDKNLTAYDLLGDLEYKTVLINKDLEALARSFSENRKLSEDILGGEAYETIISRYPETKKKLKDFLDRNGHKSDFNCYCLIAKSWNEDKDRLLKVLRPMVLAVKESADLDKEGQNKEKYQTLIKGIRETAGKSRMQKLDELITFYRFSHVYREETQYLWEAFFEECRRGYRRLQELLEDALESRDDLLYLFYGELISVCESGELKKELLQKIRLRKENRPLAEKTWEKSQLSVLKTGNDKLQGIGGSSGEAAGKVCIVTNPDEFYKLQKGDVLVCKYTDPEWTPLFALAAAVVSDTGGSLSHAAIVAREYGIPAVLGCGNATGILKDGDKVCVDGIKGEVRRVG